MYTKREFLGGGPKSDLGQDLVCERTGHHEGRVASCTAGEKQLEIIVLSTYGVPKIYKPAFCQKNNVATRWHRESINLWFDVGRRFGISLEPGHIDLNVEVADAERMWRMNYLTEKKRGGITDLQTIASSGITRKCLEVIISLFPVVVTKTLDRGAASSIVVTSYPAIAA